MAKQVEDLPVCYCVMKHPVNEEERQQLVEEIRHARETGDMLALGLVLARLSGAADCPARKA